MTGTRVSPVDNEYAVCAETDISGNVQSDTLFKFVRYVGEEFLLGQTAYLQIEGIAKDPVILEVNRINASEN